MNAIEIIRRLHQHRMWVNHQLIDAVRGLTGEQLRRPFSIGQASVWNTLTHLLAAEYVWLGTLQGDEACVFPGDSSDRLPGNQEAEEKFRSLEDLEQLWKQVDQDWQRYLDGLTEAQLDELVHKRSVGSSPGVRRATTRADALLHVCTHAHYTTAQLINILRRLGVCPLPDPMLITMAREQTQS